MMKRRLSRHALLPALAALAFAGGCKQTDPGSALIKYRIGNDKTCQESNVEMIRVVLDESDGIEDEGVCGNGEFEFTGIPVGNYTVRVYGLNPDGVAIVDNLDDQETKIKVEGDGKELETNTVVLGDAPAQLFVRWDFDFTDCAAAGIDRFRIEGFDQDGSNILVSDEIDCAGASGYQLVDDPDRELNGNEFGEAGVRPLDSDGNEVGAAALFTFEPPTPGYPINLSVTCTADGCTGTGTPD